jgi:hypothetical protein
MRGVSESVQGGFFSRKKPLDGCGFAKQQLENCCNSCIDDKTGSWVGGWDEGNLLG